VSAKYALGVVGALGVFAWTVLLVRRGLLGEKFAVVWLSVSATCLTLALVPEPLFVATRLLGFELPVNLLFVGGACVQLLVSLQLSIEVGRRQSESRRLAEELALLEARVTVLSRALDARPEEFRWPVLQR